MTPQRWSLSDGWHLHNPATYLCNTKPQPGNPLPGWTRQWFHRSPGVLVWFWEIQLQLIVNFQSGPHVGVKSVEWSVFWYTPNSQGLSFVLAGRSTSTWLSEHGEGRVCALEAGYDVAPWLTWSRGECCPWLQSVFPEYLTLKDSYMCFELCLTEQINHWFLRKEENVFVYSDLS